jgi:hypothetical protein
MSVRPMVVTALCRHHFRMAPAPATQLQERGRALTDTMGATDGLASWGQLAGAAVNRGRPVCTRFSLGAADVVAVADAIRGGAHDAAMRGAAFAAGGARR